MDMRTSCRNFMDNLFEILTTFENNKSEFMLTGDYKIDLLKIDENDIHNINFLKKSRNKI